MEPLIPKISNYKEYMLDHSITPIFNKNYTMFEKEGFIYPYLETYFVPKDYEFSNIDLCDFIIDKEGYQIYKDNEYYILSKNYEKLSFIRMDGNTIVSHYCPPKHQRFGYIRLMIDYLIRKYRTMYLPKSIDNDYFIKVFYRRLGGIDKVEDNNGYTLSYRTRIDRLNLRMDLNSHHPEYARLGICSYVENYWKYNP